MNKKYRHQQRVRFPLVDPVLDPTDRRAAGGVDPGLRRLADASLVEE